MKPLSHEHTRDAMWFTTDPWSPGRNPESHPDTASILAHRARESLSLESVTRRAERAEARAVSAEIRASSAETRAEAAERLSSMTASLVQELKVQIGNLRQQLEPERASRTEASVRVRFFALAKQWRDECTFTSSLNDMFSHRAYREIVSLGMMAVPLLLRDIEATNDYWGQALREITGANPVPKSAAGHADRVAKAWVRWGKKSGYYW
jgi:hypothetical protein